MARYVGRRRRRGPGGRKAKREALQQWGVGLPGMPHIFVIPSKYNYTDVRTYPRPGHSSDPLARRGRQTRQWWHFNSRGWLHPPDGRSR